ncbi:GAF domain-containing protein [Acidomonas methanolica]|uniref:GAF domain-containing protein n=1 Tax=Acidomonas methanolica TaxID=437 RepID=UPI00351CDE37
MSAPSERLAPEDLVAAIGSVVGTERDLIATMANVSAMIYEALPDLNWAGFYLFKEGELVLGPFQGRLACTRIPLGRGVCGTAAARRETIVVEDVHAFPGHIACDAASASEIVVPVIAGERLVGVLDVDSPLKACFGDAEREMMEAIAAIVAEVDL